MKILADENISRDVVAWLRSTGHDVLAASETDPGAEDIDWASIAMQDQRLILTFDKDFGELVFRDGLPCHGIVLMRLDELTGAEILERIQNAWSVVEANPFGMFIVITEQKVRVRPLTTTS